jgi:hypothetical protein
MNNWIALIDLPAGTDGVHGGKNPWHLQALRITPAGDHGHWWEANATEPDRGLTVFRDENDQVCRIVLVSSEPFESAALTYNLNARVFGSPTLWPLAHRPQSREGKSFGWVWTFDEESPFPFR